MVNQREGTSQETLQPASQTPAINEGDGLDDSFQVVDETPDEQRQLETELDSGTERPEREIQDPLEQGAVEPEAESQESTDTEDAQVQQPERPEATPEPETPAETPPAARTYSVEEVARIQAAKDRERDDERRRANELQAQLDARNLEAEVEAAVRRQEAQLAPSLGDEEARRVARDPNNVANIRANQQAVQENAQLKRERQQDTERAEADAKQIIARQLMDRFHLQTNDYELLLGTTTPAAMQSLAQRLQTQTLNQRQQEQERKARVPAETPETQLESGHSTGRAPETPERRIHRLNQMDASDWSDEEWKFMRDGRM